MLSTRIAITLGRLTKDNSEFERITSCFFCTTDCNNLVTPMYTANTCIHPLVWLRSFYKSQKRVNTEMKSGATKLYSGDDWNSVGFTYLNPDFRRKKRMKAGGLPDCSFLIRGILELHNKCERWLPEPKNSTVSAQFRDDLPPEKLLHWKLIPG